METKQYKIFTLFTANLLLLIFISLVFAFTFNETRLRNVSATADNVIYAGNEKTNKVSLMINVYWGNEYLEGMLNTLKKYNVKTTFFVGGSWCAMYPELLKRIFDEGHEIGNHGYNHKNHEHLNFEANNNEISLCDKVVFEHIKVKMNLFAPPSGSYSNMTIKVAENLGYKTIMWTRDTVDWRDKDAEVIYNRAVKNIKSGDLILMHPTEKTAEALERIIKTINQSKLTITTVSDTIKN